MDLPKFPRHLTPEERAALRGHAARAFADDLIAKMESKADAKSLGAN